MADTDKLRPEVREAVDAFDIGARVGMTFGNKTWNTIRAELLHLAVRNAELEARATRDHEWFNDLLTENKKAEAELAALKARIAEAPVASVRVDDRMHVSIGARSNAVDFVPLHTKHVALVKVEE